MRSIRNVTNAYNKIVSSVENKESMGCVLQINVYKCSCGAKTVTKDVHKGVTPMFHDCERCKEMAKSCFYQVDQKLTPTQHWYRPSLKKCLKMRKNEHQEDSLNHILSGGLINRII